MSTHSISIQTSGFLNDAGGYDEKFAMLHAAGFDAIDYNINSNYPSSDMAPGKRNAFFSMSTEEICEHLTPFKQSAYKNGLFFGQMHAPYPSYVPGNEAANRFLIEAMEKSIAAAAFLECPYVVVHPAMIEPTRGYEEEYRLNMERYQALIPAAKKYGVTVCLENMFYTAKGHIYEASCMDFHEAVHYIDDLNNIAGVECFAFCYDLGHANILGKNNRRSLQLLGSRVKTLHLHDNNTREDLHLMPFTFAANWGIDHTTDWNGLIRGLADIDYRGTINFETHQIYHVFPKSVHPQMLALMAAIGRYFSDEIEKARNNG